MTSDATITYFVARNMSGKVTHLVRTIQTETTLRAEYFQDGTWYEDSSAFAIADDGSASKPIPEAEAQKIIDEQLKSQPPDSQAAIHQGFSNYFLGQSPALPVPIPEKGAISGQGWNVRFVLSGDPPILEFLAEQSMNPPIRGRIYHDGREETLESYVDHFYVNPSLGETEEDGMERMQEHNNRVTAELRAIGLL